jgi:arylsulfatase B
MSNSNRRYMLEVRYILLAIFFIRAPIVAIAVTAHSEQTRMPNIVLIVADDLGRNGVGYHDGFVRTPHIDRIATNGVELDRFYVSPMCSPTRAGLLTGRYPMRFGMARSVVRPWARFGLPPAERTLPEALAEVGYRHRGAFGKWHLGHLEPQWHPLSQGFTHFEGCYNGAANYFTRDRDGEMDWHVDGEPTEKLGYTTDIIADAASQFIARRAKESPFLCYVAFTAPHEPLQAPRKYLKRYANLDDNRNDHKSSDKQAVAAMIACMDDGIGRILEAIKNAGIMNETIVWFISDNGGLGHIPGYNEPLRSAKLTVYEGGVRVPSAVWWPGVIEGGHKIEAPIMFIDVMPTLFGFLGKAIGEERPLDGVDVSRVLTGESATTKKRDLYFFTGQTGLQSELIAVTSPQGWKLVVKGMDVRQRGYRTPGHTVELFNVLDDPTEAVDRSGENPEIVNELGAKLVAFRRSEPDELLAPMNRKPPGFDPPTQWRNVPPRSRSEAK